MSSSRSKKTDEDDSVQTTETHLISFPKIVDGGINTNEFLQAARGVVQIIDKLGKLFAPVKYDMQGNIDKLTTRYTMNEQANITLQAMILMEKATETNLVATDALMWLTRGLHMILLFFERIIEDNKTGKRTEDLVAFLKKSYKEALEPYHGWMAQQLFGLLSRMVPTRTQLLQALADGETARAELILTDMEPCLNNFRDNVSTIQIFYKDHDLENSAIV